MKRALVAELRDLSPSVILPNAPLSHGRAVHVPLIGRMPLVASKSFSVALVAAEGSACGPAAGASATLILTTPQSSPSRLAGAFLS